MPVTTSGNDTVPRWLPPNIGANGHFEGEMFDGFSLARTCYWRIAAVWTLFDAKTIISEARTQKRIGISPARYIGTLSAALCGVPALRKTLAMDTPTLGKTALKIGLAATVRSYYVSTWLLFGGELAFAACSCLGFITVAIIRAGFGSSTTRSSNLRMVYLVILLIMTRHTLVCLARVSVSRPLAHQAV